MKTITSILAVLLPLLAVSPTTAETKRDVRHPNLLLNHDEIEQVRAKIKKQPWAAKLFQRVRALADEPGRTGRTPREAALVYALTGEKRYADAVRRALVDNSRYYLKQYEKVDLKLDPDFGAWGPWATWAWAYDLTYDTFSDAERKQVEELFRTAARTIIAGLKLRSTTPNLVFEKHWKVGLLGYCLGDRELIEWGLNDPGHHGPTHGGFYQVLDTMIKDQHFWGESPIYALHYDVHGMLALAEAALHYDGTDLYHYTSKKSGASIKKLIDGYLLTAYPLERTGIGKGSLRMATFGDGSTSYSPRGELRDTFLVNPVSDTLGEPTLSGELEVAYKRYKDPGYAWLLALNPRRDQYIGSPGQGGNRPVWGFVALTHGEALPDKLTPPPAPCGLYPSQGFALLRADESPRYWESGAVAAVVRLGALVGHGHKDYFEIILHGKGRLLYPDLNVIQYEPTWLHWTHEGIAHNTLLVDRRSPRPGPFTTRHDFAPGAKFFAVSGSAFDGVRQTRALLMTPDYVADAFHAADTRGRPRTFDWVLHGLGRLYPGNPAAYRPTSALVPHYWWIDNERGRKTDKTWQAEWVQKSGGVTRGLQPLGKEWFDQAVGVRMTMLGVPGTEVFHGDGPLADGPPYHRLDGNPEGSSPLVVARRRAAATIFTAVHEPYDRRPSVYRVEEMQKKDEAVGLLVEGHNFSDRVLMSFRPDREYTLEGRKAEEFTFRDHAYVRIAGKEVTASGRISSLRVLAPDAKKFTLNGKAQEVRHQNGYLVYGKEAAPDFKDPRETEREEAGPEQRAWAHYHFLPEEVHLRAGGEKEVALHLRCVGAGETRGRLLLSAPKGITVEPKSVDVGPMKEGEEKVVRLRVKAAADAANALHSIRITPEKDFAAAGTLPVSVGVVMTEETRVPLAAQWVVRAPGYTMKVDQYSGVSYYLLDADGHRRHGSIHNTNFCFGLPAVERNGQWVFRYGRPCRFVWDGKRTLTVGSANDRQDGRLRYAFHEDRIALSLVPPTNPTQEFNLWLGNFDALGRPKHDGTQKAPHLPVEASWLFFPHPVHRQGVLLTLPGKKPVSWRGSALSLPLRAGQEVSLRFATEGELPGLVEKK